jgi:hypothetical protein
VNEGDITAFCYKLDERGDDVMMEEEIRSREFEMRIDPLEEMRIKFKTSREFKRRRSNGTSFRGCGSLKLLRCDVCKITTCTSDWKKKCECGREMNLVLSPVFWYS